MDKFGLLSTDAHKRIVSVVQDIETTIPDFVVPYAHGRTAERRFEMLRIEQLVYGTAESPILYYGTVLLLNDPEDPRQRSPIVSFNGIAIGMVFDIEGGALIIGNDYIVYEVGRMPMDGNDQRFHGVPVYATGAGIGGFGEGAGPFRLKVLETDNNPVIDWVGSILVPYQSFTVAGTNGSANDPSGQATIAPIFGPDIQSVGVSNEEGTSNKFAREDHVHAGSGYSLTVKESDNDPTVNDVTIIVFDQASFTITPVSGVPNISARFGEDTTQIAEASDPGDSELFAHSDHVHQAKLTVQQSDEESILNVITTLSMASPSFEVSSEGANHALVAPVFGDDIQTVSVDNEPGDSELFARDNHIHKAMYAGYFTIYDVACVDGILRKKARDVALGSDGFVLSDWRDLGSLCIQCGCDPGPPPPSPPGPPPPPDGGGTGSISQGITIDCVDDIRTVELETFEYDVFGRLITTNTVTTQYQGCCNCS